MTAVNLIIMCLISQGPKGTYPTYVIANYVDSQNYYTISRSKADSHEVNKPGKKIKKSSCKVVYDYDSMKIGQKFKRGGKDHE